MKTKIQIRSAILATIAVLFLLLNADCSYDRLTEVNSVEANKSGPRLDIERKIKEQTALERNNTAADNLEEVRTIQSTWGRRNGMLQPASLTLDINSDIYISDNNGHTIHHLPAGSDSINVLQLQGNDAKLEWPMAIHALSNMLYVNDNQGIKVFDNKGRFLRLLKVYYQVNDFAVARDHSIYVNPQFRAQKPNDPLIVHLDKSGKLLKGFGARINRKDHYSLEDRAYILTNGNYIVAAFRHQPRVQIYTKSGKLMSNIVIEHPTFDRLITLSDDEKYIRPSTSTYRLPTYIAGAATVDDRILVLLDLPVPEIVELNFVGQEVNRYRGRLGSLKSRRYCGFDCQVHKAKYQFWIASHDDTRNSYLTELTVSSK
jgi:hypothetical protein